MQIVYKLQLIFRDFCTVNKERTPGKKLIILKANFKSLKRLCINNIHLQLQEKINLVHLTVNLVYITYISQYSHRKKKYKLNKIPINFQ